MLKKNNTTSSILRYQQKTLMLNLNNNLFSKLSAFPADFIIMTFTSGTMSKNIVITKTMLIHRMSYLTLKTTKNNPAIYLLCDTFCDRYLSIHLYTVNPHVGNYN